jgi:hypothetical protein
VKVCQIVIEVEFGIYKEILLIKGDSSLILYKLISQYSTQDFCQTRQKYIKLKCHWYDIIEVVEFGINKGGVIIYSLDKNIYQTLWKYIMLICHWYDIIDEGIGEFEFGIKIV